MSAILDKLLKGQKVEWLPLGEACEIADNLRKPVKSSLRVAGNIPYYGANNIQDYVEGYTHNGEYVLIAEDGSANLENYSIQWATGKFWANNHVHVVKGKENLDSRFLYHFLRFMNFIPYLTGGDRAKLTKAKMVEIPIPIPPLDVQAEIVRILDAFTAVTAELTQELAKEKILREKQYQYYRDKLLSFSEAGIATDSNRQQQTALCEGLANNVKQNHQIIWKSLGEVAEYSKSRISFDKLNEKNYIGVDNLLQNRMGKTNSSYLPTSGNLTAYFENDILIGNIRPYLKKIWQANQIGGTNGDVLVIHLKDKNILPRYLYQILADDKFFDFNMQNAKGAKMPRGNKEAILKYSFPVPPLDEQKRIVNILDKFEALTHSITEGLPKEITLRKQQYEYYREQLIDFPKN